MALRVPNAIDMHVHFGPDAVGGTLTGFEMESVSAVEAARDAAAAGLGAVVLKSHSFASPSLARNIQEAVPGIRLFGGICTDYISGGLNLDGVEAALSLGAKSVWLPTLHSRQDFGNLQMMTGVKYHEHGIAVTDDDGNVVPAVHEIFAMLQQVDGILATGHTTADEHYAVVREFGTRGKVVVTHAGEKLAGPRLTPQQSRELAELGGVIEVTAQMCKELFGHPGMTPAEVLAMCRMIGPERVCLSTDFGWGKEVPRPADGMVEFLDALWGEGVSEDELVTMVSTNPARLLGIDA
jgi:hypothetical protein